MLGLLYSCDSDKNVNREIHLFVPWNHDSSAFSQHTFLSVFWLLLPLLKKGRLPAGRQGKLRGILSWFNFFALFLLFKHMQKNHLKKSSDLSGEGWPWKSYWILLHKVCTRSVQTLCNKIYPDFFNTPGGVLFDIESTFLSLTQAAADSSCA